MNLLKNNLALLSAAVLCLSLTACGDKNDDSVAGADWRTWGIVRDSGIITRNGENTDVLVCLSTEDADFYYDTEEQVLFDSVHYPLTLEGDPWEMFKSIDFADLNGDGNSDVTMKFVDGESELKMVWLWDTENQQFMFEPFESEIGEEGRGDLIIEEEGQEDLIPEYDDEGNPIPEDDGRGDLIPDEGDTVPVLMGGALPFTNMENLQSENYEDGTYYYADATEGEQIHVVNMVTPSNFMYDVQTLEDYLTACATSLSESDSFVLQSVEQNDVYTEKMTYPVFIITYTAGENEDAREWTFFAMDTDRYTYFYGFGATLEGAEDMRSIYDDIFVGLYLSDGELEE